MIRTVRWGTSGLVQMLFFFICTSCAFAQLSAVDDRGVKVQLSAPARRIVTLTPHATELVVAAGGSNYLVATVNASNYPAFVRTLPRLGEGLQPEPERILRFKPDLLIGWQASQFSTLQPLRIATFLSAPKTLSDIPNTIEKIGDLLGTEQIAQPRAALLRTQLKHLTQSSPAKLPVRVFLQVGEPPEYSLNHTHLLSQVIEACGGLNIFANAAAIAPQISPESVLSQHPELVLLGRVGASATPQLDTATQQYWSRFKLPAAQAGRVFVMDSDVLYRPGPRLIEAADAICSMIQDVRQ